MEELDPRLKGYHKLIAQLRNDKFSIMSEFKLLEARICLKDTLIGAINTDDDAELYNQFKDGYLTLTQFVSDDERYYLLYAFVNLDEAQAAHKILDTRMPRNLKEVK